MKPFSPLHSQLKSPQKSAFFKRLSLKLVSSFSLTNIKNAKKDFASKPKKRNFKKSLKEKSSKKRKRKFKKRKALKEIP
ncbi:hypothetical protein HpVa75_00590 [Helicobacter pylori]